MIVTISRQYGAGGSEVASRVAARLGWELVDNELIDRVAARAGLAPEEVAEREERAPGFIERLARTLAAATPELFPPREGTVREVEEANLVRITESVVAEMAAGGNVVLVGRAAPAVLSHAADAVHVKLVAPHAFRVRIICERFGMLPDAAAHAIDEMDARRQRYHREYYQRDWSDPANYHMTLNTGALGFDGAADLVVGCVKRQR